MHKQLYTYQATIAKPHLRNAVLFGATQQPVIAIIATNTTGTGQRKYWIALGYYAAGGSERTAIAFKR